MEKERNNLHTSNMDDQTKTHVVETYIHKPKLFLRKF